MSANMRLIFSHAPGECAKIAFPDKPCLALVGPFVSHTDRPELQNALTNLLSLENGYNTETVRKELLTWIASK